MNEPRRQPRFQFSLRLLLFVMFVVVMVGGTWLSSIRPILAQWKAVEPIMELDGRVETVPSNLPGWLKGIMPTGKTENIEAVFFQYRSATDEAIDALAKLPHLRRLYVEKTNLQPRHIEKIAQLDRLERLSLWDQTSLSNADVAKLSRLSNLDVLNMEHCRGVDWRVLLAFRDLPKTKIKHTLMHGAATDVELEEYENLLSVQDRLAEIKLFSCHDWDANQLEKTLEMFPDIRSIWLSFSKPVDEALMPAFLKLGYETDVELYITIDRKHENVSMEQRRRHYGDALKKLWATFGPLSDEIEIKANSQYPPSNRLILRRNAAGDVKEKQVVVYVDDAANLPASLFESLSPLPSISSLVFQMDDGSPVEILESVFAKTPNVRQLEGHQIDSKCETFWRPAAKFRKLETLSVIYHGRLHDEQAVAESVVPIVFLGDCQSRETLTKLELNVAVDKGWLKLLRYAFPKLEELTYVEPEEQEKY
ncbi:MAG: hypothetical protein AAF497_08540 [Planctomycetota bacterium]